MVFWILWFVGIVITIVTRLMINKTFNSYFTGRWGDEATCNVNYDDELSLDELKKGVKVLLHLFVIVCIILVGGIAVALFMSTFHENGWSVQIAAGIIPALLTYIVGYGILGLYKFDDRRSQICFAVVFIIAVFGWTALINDYNQKNVETGVIETTIEQTQQRNLLYFCNVPVQNITGEVSGSSTIAGGSVSGSVDTTHELTYWYASENDKALFDTAEANSSEIVFIKEGEIPYIEIISYYRCEKEIDHNIGFERICEENRWKHYVFHLPENIMQHTLN